MDGSGRVHLWQPYMQGRKPRLGSKTSQGQHKQGREQAGASMAHLFKRAGKYRAALQGIERGVARGLPQQGKEGHQGHSAQMRGHKVNPRSIAYLAVAIIKINKKEGRQRHDFPRQHKQHGIAGGHDQGKANKQHMKKEPVRPKVVAFWFFVPQGNAPGCCAHKAQPKNW